MLEKINYYLGRAAKRWQDACGVLRGTQKIIAKKDQTSVAWDHSPFTAEEQQFISSISIEFIFCEFGEVRTNAGDNVILESRLNPSLKSLRRFFPTAKFTVYSDFDLNEENVELIKTESPLYNKHHPRYGYRTADYFKFQSLLNSEADFKCVLDADMMVVSSDAIALLYLTQKFGFCVPHNVRQILKQDMDISQDVQIIADRSRGMGYSYNQSPMTLWAQDARGLQYYQNCAEIMLKDPSRASLVMWKAAWETGIYPYVLPKQWCVCEGEEGADYEVMLHLGHKKVENYYKAYL